MFASRVRPSKTEPISTGVSRAKCGNFIKSEFYYVLVSKLGAPYRMCPHFDAWDRLGFNQVADWLKLCDHRVVPTTDPTSESAAPREIRYSWFDRLWIFLTTIPGAKKVYDILRLTFVPRLREDNLACMNHPWFVEDPGFHTALEAARRQDPSPSARWRVHVTQWAGAHAARLDGDFVECGVNRGFMSASAMEYIGFGKMKNRKFYLFDTFRGFEPTLVSTEDHGAFRHYYPDCHEFVVNSFAKYPNVVIVKGAVPETLTQVNIDRVAYLHIDMNCTKPEEEAMRFFWPKLVPGGVIVLDDYGCPRHESQAKAARRFADSVGAKILCLPTAQGLIFKV